jgi:hypothetical protein
MPTVMSDVRAPRLEARIAGVLYILVILLGGFAEIAVRQGLVTPDNPGATARAIMTHEGLFRLGFAAEMATNVIAIPLTLIFYRLLAPAARFWVLLAVALDLTQNTVNAVNAWTQFAPLTLLSGSPGAEVARRGFRHRPDLLRLRAGDLWRGDVPLGVFSQVSGGALWAGRRLLSAEQLCVLHGAESPIANHFAAVPCG